MNNLDGSKRGNEPVDRRLAGLATTQFGVFSREQALDHGASPRQIQRRVSQGRWHAALPRVYAIAGTSSDQRRDAMAATLWAGEGALISHGTAGLLWGIDGVRGSKTELWVPMPRNPRAGSVVVHRGERLDRADRTMLGPIPVTTAVRTLIDVSGSLEDDRLLAAMECVFRRQLGTPDRLLARLAALRHSGRPGAGRLAALLEQRGDGRPLESMLEAKVWQLLSGAGLPLPARQHWVSTSGGRYRLDFAWPEHKLGLEADGWELHSDRVAFGKDRERMSEMVAVGWRVLLVTWDVGTRQPRRVVRWVEMALAA